MDNTDKQTANTSANSSGSASPLGPQITTNVPVGNTDTPPIVKPTAPENTPNDTPIAHFPGSYNLVLLLPILYLLSSGFGSSIDDPSIILIAALVLLASGIGIIWLYVMQWRFIKNNFGSRGLRINAGIILAAVILPIIAAFLGDAAGITHFNDTSGQHAYGTGLFFGGIWGGTVFYLMCLGNAITIGTRANNRAVRVLGIIAKTIIMLITFVASYLSYTVAYSSHDPQSE